MHLNIYWEKTERKGIEYQKLEMADYLTPLNKKLNIENKRIMFSVRNRMVDIKSNFKAGKIEIKCICGQKETMEHVWNCKLVNDEAYQKENYEQIFNGNLTQQVRIYEKFNEKLERYNMINIKQEKCKHPCDPSCNSDPLFLFCKEQQGI